MWRSTGLAQMPPETGGGVVIMECKTQPEDPSLWSVIRARKVCVCVCVCLFPFHLGHRLRAVVYTPPPPAARPPPSSPEFLANLVISLNASLASWSIEGVTQTPLSSCYLPAQEPMVAPIACSIVSRPLTETAGSTCSRLLCPFCLSPAGQMAAFSPGWSPCLKGFPGHQ
jgi:hypothetical protein